MYNFLMLHAKYWLKLHAMFDVVCIQAFVGVSDIILSVMSSAGDIPDR